MTFIDSNRDASYCYIEGRHAFCRGDAVSTNPYLERQDFHRHWNLGWTDEFHLMRSNMGATNDARRQSQGEGK